MEINHEIALVEQAATYEVSWENQAYHYETASDVVRYVTQNPWTKFDPTGLFSYPPQMSNPEFRQGFYDQAPAAAMMGVVGASMIPGVGEAMDFQVMTSSKSSTIEKVGAGLSLLANIAVGGVAPNYAGVKNGINAAEGVIDTMKATDKAADGLTPSAKVVEEGKPVAPGTEGSYGELKNHKDKYGETEAMDMDHRPSFAAQAEAAAKAKGQPLTDAELKALKNDTPAVATPRADHQKKSRTYGGRNTKEQIKEDAKDLKVAKEKDDKALE